MGHLLAQLLEPGPGDRIAQALLSPDLLPVLCVAWFVLAGLGFFAATRRRW